MSNQYCSVKTYDSSLVNMIDLDSLDGINIINNSSEIRTLVPEPSISALSSMSHKDANLLSCMLITANVGTIFEEVSYYSKTSSMSGKFRSSR